MHDFDHCKIPKSSKSYWKINKNWNCTVHQNMTDSGVSKLARTLIFSASLTRFKNNGLGSILPSWNASGETISSQKHCVRNVWCTSIIFSFERLAGSAPLAGPIFETCPTNCANFRFLVQRHIVGMNLNCISICMAWQCQQIEIWIFYEVMQ